MVATLAAPEPFTGPSRPAPDLALTTPDMSAFSTGAPDPSSRAHDVAGEPLREAAGASRVSADAPVFGGAREAAPKRAAAAPAAVGSAVTIAPTRAPAATRIGPAWRWRQYLQQRPRWRAASCSLEVRALASDITAPRAVAECATVRTPLDWSDLTAGSITLAVTRVRDARSPAHPTSARPASRRLLLVNPGGPGVVADWLAPTVAARSGRLLGTHDIVAVDPRGTGGSTPITCPVVRDGLTDVRALGGSRLAAMQAAVRETVRGCVAADGKLLRTISTANMAGDLDLVRQVLARPVTDFYGVSAGTWLGAHYAQRYPRAVGRFVLDGNTEFSATWQQSFAWQPMGFQRRLEQQFFAWAARHHRAYGLGTTAVAVSRSYATTRAALASRRLGGMTPREFDTQTVEALYHDAGFLTLAETLRDMRRRISSGATAGNRLGAPREQPGRAPVGEYEADPSDTVFMAVQCNDSGATGGQEAHAAEGRAFGTRYPLLGWEWLTSPCAYWPWPAGTGRPGASAQVATRPLPPMLMVQTEFDPATPWEGALRAHRANPATRLVGVEDQGSHGAYLTENACVATAVDTYLAKGRLPAKNTVCPGVALPRETRTYPVGGSLAAELG